MSVTYPYPVAYLADQLKIDSVVFDIQRNDELSGSGDGRVWQAELAPPLWIATVNLRIADNNDAKQIAAKIRKLHGSQEMFFLYDPTSQYPQYDPKGTIVGSSNVQIANIGTFRESVALKGLPAGYKMTIGDKIQIAYGSSPTRYAFLEVSENAVAAAGGTTELFEVFPFVPPGVTANLVAILKKPAMRCIIVPGSHNPGTASLPMTDGATFKAVQKK